MRGVGGRGNAGKPSFASLGGSGPPGSPGYPARCAGDLTPVEGGVVGVDTPTGVYRLYIRLPGRWRRWYCASTKCGSQVRALAREDFLSEGW
eukprot:4593891-Pyramimonas_sp.AAC.2